MSRIAVLGGHGKIALLLAHDLTAAGHEVTSVFRNADHTEEVAATGAQPLVLDLESADTDTIAGALDEHGRDERGERDGGRGGALVCGWGWGWGGDEGGA